MFLKMLGKKITWTGFWL